MSAEETECCPPQKTASGPVEDAIPHPVSKKTGYPLKGKIEKIGDFDEVYVTGADDAKHAIVVIYDIFGLWETTMRGSDQLATHLQLTKPTKIFMPDVFRGSPFPPDEKGDKTAFFAGTAKLSDRLPEVIDFAKRLKAGQGFSQVSILGYCWGGKLALLALSSALPNPTPFCCGATVHPAMISAEDGDNLAVPLAFYPSHDEPKDVVKAIKTANEEKFGKKVDYHLYDTVHHGWAAARADLNSAENLKQYEAVYKRLADFFARSC